MHFSWANRPIVNIIYPYVNNCRNASTQENQLGYTRNTSFKIAYIAYLSYNQEISKKALSIAQAMALHVYLRNKFICVFVSRRERERERERERASKREHNIISTGVAIYSRNTSVRSLLL